MMRKKKGTGSAARVNAVGWGSVSAGLEQYGRALARVFFADDATAVTVVTAGYQPYAAC